MQRGSGNKIKSTFKMKGSPHKFLGMGALGVGAIGLASRTKWGKKIGKGIRNVAGKVGKAIVRGSGVGLLTGKRGGAAEAAVQGANVQAGTRGRSRRNVRTTATPNQATTRRIV